MAWLFDWLSDQSLKGPSLMSPCGWKASKETCHGACSHRKDWRSWWAPSASVWHGDWWFHGGPHSYSHLLFCCMQIRLIQWACEHAFGVLVPHDWITETAPCTLKSPVFRFLKCQIRVFGCSKLPILWPSVTYIHVQNTWQSSYKL